MIGPNRYTLDANILVYAADRSAGSKRDYALEVMALSARKETVCILQSLGEFFHAVTRKRLLGPEEARRFIDSCKRVYRVHAADVGDLDAALDLRERRSISFWDAMLVSTAASAGCTVLLSEDMQDGEMIGGVRIADPFKHSLEELGLAAR